MAGPTFTKAQQRFLIRPQVPLWPPFIHSASGFKAFTFIAHCADS